MKNGYSKTYLKEKFDRIKWTIESLMSYPENGYVKYPENIDDIRYTLRDAWESIKCELGL